MRPPTEVFKLLSLRIETDLRAGRTIDIVGLVFIALQPFDRFFARHTPARIGAILCDNLRHLRLDLCEIRRPDRIVQVDIVVKTVPHSRSIDQLSLRPNGTDRFGHHVGAGVPHDLKTLLIITGKYR